MSTYNSFRHIFEESYYESYENAHLRLQLSGQFIDKIPPNELFRMKPDGTYRTSELNHSWNGYCMGVRDVLESQNQNKESSVEE